MVVVHRNLTVITVVVCRELHELVRRTAECIENISVKKPIEVI